MDLPIVYLNKATFRDQSIIKIIFKNNKQIHTIIKESEWIAFNQECGTWTLPYSEKNINVLKDLFDGVADVNTYYLHAVTKVRADEIIFSKDLAFKNILPIAIKKGSILLLPVKSNNEQKVLIRFKYNKDIYPLLKNDYLTEWEKNLRCFYIPAKSWVLKNFISRHVSQLKIMTHHQMQIIEIDIRKLLMEQHYLKTITFKSCPDSFLKNLVLENKSWNTIKIYHYYLLRFINTFQANTLGQINDFDVQKINDYHYYLLQEKRYSTKSINQSVNAVKYYYRSVLNRNMDFDNISRGKKSRDKPKFYSREEINNILNATENIKHRAMLMLSYSAGLRISELLQLKITDILPDRKQIFIKGGKGDSDRYTILSEKALIALRIYAKEYKPKVFLFEGQYGGKYSASSVRNVLHKAVTKANVTKKGSAHSLRHSFATHLLESGVDVRYVQALLGHKSLKTTEIYTHVTNTHLQLIKSPLDSLPVKNN